MNKEREASVPVDRQPRVVHRYESVIADGGEEQIKTIERSEDGSENTKTKVVSTDSATPFMAERGARHARLIAYTDDRKSDPIIVDIIRELLER